MIVVDCCLMVAYLTGEPLAEKHRMLAQRIADGGSLAHVPAIFFTEFANALRQSLRRKHITLEGWENAVQTALAMRVTADDFSLRPSAIRPLSRISEAYNLTVYDASYLELAIRLGYPLATLDAELIKAARKEEVQYV